MLFSSDIFYEWLKFDINWKVVLILTAIYAFYAYYTLTYDYFKKKGIPYVKPIILLGNFGPRIALTKSFHDYSLDIYKKFKGERYAGVFEGRQPVLYIFDPELIKAVLIRDFHHFTDRNIISSKKPRYLSRSLVALKAEEWKSLRSTMTPVFSLHRLKNMLPLMQVCSEHIVQYLKQYENKDVEMKEAMGRYSLETIGACAFGIKYDTLSERNLQFVKAVEKFNYMPKMKRVMTVFIQLFYSCSTFMQLVLNRDATEDLVSVLKAAKAERRITGSTKRDFLQILVDVASNQNNEQNGKNNGMDDDTIDAQCLLFLIAGYESSSSLLAFAAHVMATQPELQERLRTHILNTTDGKQISYELLAELTYLEAFLLETLRMYPPVPAIDREVTKTYQLPGTNILLTREDKVAVPSYALHMDPEHYPEPNEFRPERFMGDEKKNRPAHLFLAFGAGPRNCIGTRFAMLSAKLVMVSLLKHFKFSTCSNTETPITFNKAAFFLRANSGLWVRVESSKSGEK